MKLVNRWSAVLLAVAMASGAAAATPAKSKPKPMPISRPHAIGAMEATLADVTDEGEKSRWTQNLGLWKHVVEKNGDLKSIDYETFGPEKADLTGAIASMPENHVKERWEADEALW